MGIIQHPVSEEKLPDKNLFNRENILETHQDPRPRMQMKDEFDR